jgi:hypothetical protein
MRLSVGETFTALGRYKRPKSSKISTEKLNIFVLMAINPKSYLQPLKMALEIPKSTQLTRLPGLLSGEFMKKGLHLLPLLLLGCSGDLPEAALKAKREAELSAKSDSGLSLEAQRQKKFSELQTLRAENDTMCLRVQKQRVECPLSVPLVPGDSEKVLGCVSGVADGATVASEFKLDVQPPSGTKIYLSIKGGTWRTQEVGAGTGQKLIWGPKSPDSCNPNLRVNPANIQAKLRSPKLLELSDLEVVVVPDDKSQCYSTRNRLNDFGAFELSVNGEVVFRRPDLSFRSGSYSVSLAALDKYLNNPKCIVPVSELEALFAEAKTNVAAPKASPDALAKAEDEHARETARNQSLRLELTGQEKLGCWAFAKIEKLEVKIDGAAVARASLGNGGQLKNEGNSKGYNFYFGRGLTHAISEENGVFKPGGGFVTNAFSDKEIQELNFLRITREGTSYDNEEYTYSYGCGFLGLGTCTGRSYRRYETNRRSISSIKILVNDQLLYENNNVGFTFSREKREWPPNGKVEKIQDNPKFRDLMRSTSCPAG